ncbi:MAG: hypothetical protein N2249_01480 [Melioribacter sp.]|nr:hypothetical protein [Melioribacter sp.]
MRYKSFLFLFLLTILNLKAQQPSIELQILSDLSAIDFSAFAFERNLENQPRIMQVIINPPQIEVIVEGIIYWKKDQISNYVEVGRFKTEPFISRSFFNDEIGQMDISLASSSYNSELVKEILEKGKPSGIILIRFNLIDKQNNLLATSEKSIVLLNPTPPTILSPQENSELHRGSILVTWTSSPGAVSYKILANYYSEGLSYEEALNAGNPLVNNRNVGNVTSVDLKDLLDRELIEDTTVVIAVKAIVNLPGREEELKSPPVKFKVVRAINEQRNQQDDYILQLINLFSNSNNIISDELVNFLQSNRINPEQIEITDANGNRITFSEFINIITYLNQNRDSIISITVNPK